MSSYGTEFQNQPVDISEAFGRQHNHFFIGEKVSEFDPGSASGKIRWKSYAFKQRVSYHQLTLQFEDYKVWSDVPPGEYQDDQDFPFSLSFVSPRTLRLRVAARPASAGDGSSLVLDGDPPSGDPSWEMRDDGVSATYRSPFGSVSVQKDPLHFEFRDATGKLLTRSWHLSDSNGVLNSMPTPFCYVRDSSNLHRHIAASFSLSPVESLFGGGESFTRLNKRGQKMVLWTYDAYSAQTPQMYKPVPFLMSNRGYGLFAHTTAPLTFDVGHSYDGANVLYLGDDFLDLFFFFGSPKEILSEYTAVTGRSPMPPLWSFGLWMGRESYSSEKEVRGVAEKLRDLRIASDAIHLDTDWVERPFTNAFEFSHSRFPDPEGMLSDLREQGLRASLWQFPYLHPMDDLHKEAIDNGYVVLSANGKPPVDDAVIDLSNPEAEEWYQEKLAKLLRKGVAAFTSDFGEAAPLFGLYHVKTGGYHEHNLYPLRYNKAVAEITREITQEMLQWSRSAWAGSQRYPLHWSGDPEPTSGAMAGTLRAGLSLGLCGFSFWGHFTGGFSRPSPADLYLRWLAFGMLSSHSRCHGSPPTEPWEYGADFTEEFRRIVELKYRLMPYVYAQAKLCSEQGHPMLRTLFFEYPEDPTSWFIEDEYLFGQDMLVAPLLDTERHRDVYLPPGTWIDYQSGTAREGARWHHLRAGMVPAVILVREGAAIPHVGVAQCTDDIDWENMDLVVYGAQTPEAEALLCLPEDGQLHRLRLRRREGGFELQEDPFAGRVNWRISVGRGR